VAEKVAIRAASPDDASFIAACVLQAEGAGTERVTYEQIFGLAPTEAHEMLARIARQDLPGLELTYSNFLLAEVDGQPVAGCAAWVEGSHVMASDCLKSILLTHEMGLPKWRASLDRISTFARIGISRDPDALQLDAFYVKPDFRGQGILQDLIEQHVQQHLAQDPNLRKAQIIILNHDERALRAIEKAGFHFTRETRSEAPELAALITGTGKFLLERYFDED
jgi:GNAT superfamily N-acetyltransferase